MMPNGSLTTKNYPKMNRSKSLVLFVFCLVALSAQAQWQVLFSANGGFYEDTFELELFSTYPQGRIFYTTNGNQPTTQSQLYIKPLVLDTFLYSKSDIYTIQISPDSLAFVPDSVHHCIVIRAAIFDENDSCISAVNTQSYFIKALGCDTHELPVISICADSLDLFDFERGIMVPGINYFPQYPETTGNYFMKGREWERTINVEFYEVTDNSGINQTCGLRTHGNRARKQPQKGLKIYAREEYGKKRFHHKFFETTSIDSFKHLIIKPFSSLYPYSGIQDYVCSQMAISLGLEAGDSRPIVLFINGEYWGVYFLQEKMDERYLEDHYCIDIEQCNIISNWSELENGHPDHFIEMMAWLDTTDLSIVENYYHIEDLVDLKNFTDYMILETFINNTDWPANNSRCWQLEGGKWRWMFFDGDAAFNNNTLDPFGNPIEMDVFGNATYVGENLWPSNNEATLMFRRLLDNISFLSQFDDRLRELCQSHFLFDSISPILNRVKDWIRPEMENQSFRFNNPPSSAYWSWACTLADDFLLNRVDAYIAEWETFTNNYSLEEQTASFAIYPNPSNNAIHIALLSNDRSETSEIALYDLLGRKVFSMPFQCAEGTNEIIINPNLSAGVYVLKMNGYTQRIVRY